MLDTGWFAKAIVSFPEFKFSLQEKEALATLAERAKKKIWKRHGALFTGSSEIDNREKYQIFTEIGFSNNFDIIFDIAWRYFNITIFFVEIFQGKNSNQGKSKYFIDKIFRKFY